MNETIPPITGEPQSKTPALAIWSLVLGILGVVLLLACMVRCSPFRSHLRPSAYSPSNIPAGLAGEGMALAGLITGYVSIGLSVFFWCR